jgi:nitronate monooxygenase
MPIKTAFTEACGIEVPVIQGGMHHVGFAEMAAAVSNAGGLGFITSITITQKYPDDPIAGLRAEIRKCKGLTNKPFGVNLTLLPIIGKVDMPAIVQCVIDEGVKIVETAGRNPEPVVKQLKSAGLIVIHKCTSIRHAVTAGRIGCDFIAMDGFDCGGHPGEDDVGNWVLLAKAQGKIGVPFLASGGCGNGKQLAAALAMGACGMNMGTRFMATVEAPIHDGIKKALVEADERDTTHIFRTLNNTERVFKNKTTLEVREIEKKTPGQFKAISHLVKGDNYRKSFHETGDSTDSCWSCGQSIGLIENIPTCKELLDEIVSDTEAILLKQSSYVVSKL